MPGAMMPTWLLMPSNSALRLVSAAQCVQRRTAAEMDSPHDPKRLECLEHAVDRTHIARREPPTEAGGELRDGDRARCEVQRLEHQAPRRRRA